jgi:geranylgeranyl pyrophosphate synthase
MCSGVSMTATAIEHRSGLRISPAPLDSIRELNQVRKAENALDKLKDLEKAQEMVRKKKVGEKAIDCIQKSKQNAKKLLRDIANDPSIADDM